MRALRTSLAIAAAIAALQACTHPPTPAPAAAVAAGVSQAAANPDRARAKQLIRAAIYSDFDIHELLLKATEEPRVFRFECSLTRKEGGLVCYYRLMGLVDVSRSDVVPEGEDELGCYPLPESHVAPYNFYYMAR